MNKIGTVALPLVAMLSLAMSAHAQNVDYTLPQTTMSIKVEAVREQFYAGPYANYAEKLLGIKVPAEDRQSIQITGVSLTSYSEADLSKTYALPYQYADEVLKFTSAGLMSVSDEVFANQSQWRFPTPTERDFSDKGVTSALKSESSVLYASGEADFSRISVRQDVLVKKTESQKAAETAKKILEIRDMRYRITVGDTDATYSGEALGAAINELTRLEKEYMSLFVGYTVRQTQTMTFELTPSRNVENQVYFVFRVSDAEGLLPPENVSGRPVVLEIEGLKEVPQEQHPSKHSNKEIRLYYRVPAVCTVKISDGLKLLMQTRVPIYQFGEDKVCVLPTKK